MSDAAVHAAGVDVGGTKIVALRVDADGKELARSTHPTPADDMGATLDELVAALAEVTAPGIVAVGVGAAGLVEEGTGILRFAPNLAWGDAPIGEVVGRATGVPVVVDNDCAAGAYGEFRVGAARGVRDTLYLGVGTGIGGGLILGGSVYRGAHGFSAEVGHIVVEQDGPVCGCGDRGCWETVASGTAITREGRAAARTHAPLAARAGGDPESVTGQIVVEAARDGDTVALGIVVEAGRRLGVGIAGLVNVLDPTLVVVGGGVAGAGDLLLEPARRAYTDTVEGAAYRPDVPIVEAALGTDSAAIGAALLALDTVRTPPA
jgi:glucokinase